MDFLSEFFSKLHNLDALIAWGGYVGLFCIIYAETGLMIGFFLPGDSLLVTAGVYASTHPAQLDITLLIVLLCFAAIAGDNTGYWFGRTVGPSLFARPDSRFFKRKHLMRAHDFYEHHGAKTIVLARFVPIVRTFGPIVAGVAQMPYRKFLTFSVIGGIGWISSMLLLGFYLGKIPGVKQHIDKVILLVIAVSLLPVFLHWLKERGKDHEEATRESAAPVADAGER